MENKNISFAFENWMTQIGLKNTELLVYALIFSFYRTGKAFKGSIAYISGRLGVNRLSVIRSLARLTEKGYLEKKYFTDEVNSTRCEYKPIMDKLIQFGVISQKNETPLKEQYFLIYDWMVKSFSISGHELMIFALVYSFTQNGVSEDFEGTYDYLAKRIACTPLTARRTVYKLLKKKLIKENGTFLVKLKKMHKLFAHSQESYEKEMLEDGVLIEAREGQNIDVPPLSESCKGDDVTDFGTEQINKRIKVFLNDVVKEQRVREEINKFGIRQFLQNIADSMVQVYSAILEEFEPNRTKEKGAVLS